MLKKDKRKILNSLYISKFLWKRCCKNKINLECNNLGTESDYL